VLIFEAMLLGSADRTTDSKDYDPLSIAAAAFKIDTKTLRASVAEETKQKAQKKAQKTTGKPQSAITSKRVPRVT
jgi:hypothetical protein